MATKREKILAQLSDLISSANVDIYANGKSSVIGTLASIYNIFNAEKAKEERKKQQAQDNEPDDEEDPEMNPEDDDQDQDTENSGSDSDDESGNEGDDDETSDGDGNSEGDDDEDAGEDGNGGDEGDDDEGNSEEGDPSSSGSKGSKGQKGKSKSSSSGEEGDDDEGEEGDDEGSDGSGSKGKRGKSGRGSSGDSGEDEEDDEFEPGDDDSDESGKSGKKGKSGKGGRGNSGDFDDDSDEFDDSDDEFEPGEDDGSEEGQQGNQPGQQGQRGQQPGQQDNQSGHQGQGNGEDGEDGEDYDDEYGPDDMDQGQQGNKPGQQPGQSGNQPGQQGNQPGQSGNQPGQQGNQPGQNGQQSGQQPGQSGQQPGQNGQQPGQQPGQQGGDESNPDGGDSAGGNGSNPRALKIAQADGNSSGNGHAIMDHENSHVISSQEMDEKQKSASGILKKNETDTTSPFADLDAIFGSALAGTFKRIENGGGLSAEELKAMHDLEEAIKGRQRKNKRSVVNWPAKLRKFFKGCLQIGKTRFTTPSKFHPDAALKRRREPIKPSGRKVAIFIDTSGSVFGTPGALQQFLAEITKIATGDSAFKYYDIIPFEDDINFEATLIEQPKSVIASKEWSISNITIGCSTIYDGVYNFIYDYYIDHKADEDAENLSDEEKVKIKYKPNCILIVSDTDACWDTNKFSAWASLPENEEKGEAIAKAFTGRCCFLGLYGLWQDSEEHPIQDKFAEACIPGTKVVPILYDDFAQYVDLSGQNDDEDLDENYSINNKMNTEYFTILNEGFKKGGTSSSITKPKAAAPAADPEDPQNPEGGDNTPETPDSEDNHSALFQRVRKRSKESAAALDDNAFVEEVDIWVKEVLASAWHLTKAPSEAQCRNLPQTYSIDGEGNVVINNQLSSNGNSSGDRHVGRKMSNNGATFPGKAFTAKYINANVTIKKYIGNLKIDGFNGTTLPMFIPKQIRCGENGGNFIISNCPNLNNIKNFPTYVDRLVRISGTDLTQADADQYKSIIMNSWTDFRTKNGLPLNNPPRFDANDILENNNYIMDRNIDRIVESRRRLAEAYRMQSSPIMKVNETFGHLDKENPDYESIPLELNRIAKLSYNKPIIRKLTSEIRAPWGYLTADMVDVYDKPVDYHKMIKVIPGKKEIGSDLQYGIMIFTDAQDRITYILRGKEAGIDSFYTNPDLIKLIPKRVNLMKEIKDVIENKFDIDPNSFAAGKNGNTLDEFCSKLVYDAISKYQDNATTAPANGFFNIDTFKGSTYKEICDEIKQVIIACVGGKKLHNVTKDTYTEIPDYLTFELGNTTASLMFKRIIGAYGSKLTPFDLSDVINPTLLRAILLAANIRDTADAPLFNSTSKNNYTVYDTEALENMSIGDLLDVYNEFRTMNVTNSMLYNLGIKVGGERGTLKDTEELTQPSQLIMFPDMVSHLYWIKNMSTGKRKHSSDPTIPELDFENIDKLDDPAARAEEFNSDETIRKARERFMTKGPEPYRKPGYKYTSKKSELWPKMWDNLEKYGDKAEEVRSDAMAGSYVSKKERENFRARAARAAWNASNDREDARFDARREKERLDARTRRMIDVENPDEYASAVRGDEDFMDIFNQFTRNFLTYTKVMKNGKMRCQALYNKIMNMAADSKEFKPNIFLKYYSNIYDFVTFVSKQNYKYHDSNSENDIITILNAANTLLGGFDNNGDHVSWFDDDNAEIIDAVNNQDDAQMKAAMDTITQHSDAIDGLCEKLGLKVYHYNRSSIFGNN